MSHRELPRRLGAVALAAALCAGGCSWRRSAFELGFGSFATDLRVVDVAQRGPYLDARLAGHGLNLRTFTPASEVCRAVLQPDAAVDYVERGIAGRLERGQSCDAVGIGEPLVNRARKPRATSLGGSPVPRSQATFERLYDDADVILLRGRFPEVARIGWSGGSDTVVAIPNSPACGSAAEGGVASMEYRAAGAHTLSLVGADGLCPIVGVLLPPGGPAPD
jgi:hypothetical protein